MFFATTRLPDSMQEVLLLPFILSVAAIVLWYVGLKVEANEKGPVVKYLALALVAAGLLVGGMTMMNTFEVGYTSMLDRKRIVYAHYAAFALPVLTGVTIAIWAFVNKRNNAYPEF